MKEKNNANQVKQRFSLRKLTVGVCSVLLGLTFINGNNHTVKADSVNDNNNPDAYEEVTPHSETTTNTPVKKVVVNKEASSETANTNNQNQAAASNNTPLSTAEYQQVNNAENANKKDSVKAQEFKTVSKSAANQTSVQSSANNGSNTAVQSKDDNQQADLTTKLNINRLSNARIGNVSYLSQILVQKTNNAIATVVNNETDLQNALSDNNITDIKLGEDINIDKAIEIKNLNREVTLSGLNSDGTKYSKVNHTLKFTGDSQITFTGDYRHAISPVLHFNDINFDLATTKTPFVYDAKNLTTIKADFNNVYVNKTMRSDFDSDQDDSQDFLIENNQYTSTTDTSTGTGTSGEGYYNHLNNFNMDFSGTNKFEGTAVRFTQITLKDGADVEGSLREQNANGGVYTSTIGENAKLIMKLNNPVYFDEIWYDDGNQSLNIEQGATFELLNGNNHGSLMENAIVNSPKLVIIESNQGFTNYTRGKLHKWTIQNKNGQKLGLSLSKEDGPNYTWLFTGHFTITHEPGKDIGIEGNLSSTTDDTSKEDIPSKGHAEINMNSKENFENLAGTSFTRIAFGTDLNKVFDANRYNATNSKPVSVLLDQSGTSHYLGDARSLVKITDSENSEIDSEIDTKSIEWIDGDVYNASGNKIIGSIKNGNFTFANGLTDDTTSLKPTDANSENLNRFARIKVTYEDGTTDIVPVKIDIIKAKAKQNSQSKPLNPSNSNFEKPITSQDTITGQPTDKEAKNLVDNTSDLSQSNPTYTFVDDNGKDITNFENGTLVDNNHKLLQVNVKVSYWKNNNGTYIADGYQIVKGIYLELNSDSKEFDENYQSVKGTVDAHAITDSANAGQKVPDYKNGLINSSTQISYIDANNKSQTIALSSLPGYSSIAWKKAIALNLDINGSNSYDAVITFKDGSTKDIKVTVNVKGGIKGSKSITTVNEGNNLTSDEALEALTGSSLLDIAQWLESNKESSFSWAANEDGTGTPDTNYSAEDNTTSRTAYVVITYKDGTKQTVEVLYTVKTQADLFGNGSIKVADGKQITTHVNKTSGELDPTVDLSIKDGNGNTVNDWKFAGWVDADHNPLTLDLTKSGLTDGYAKIALKDGSYVYSTKLLITVLGGEPGVAVNQSVIAGTKDAPAADQHISNADSLNRQFSLTSSSYSWYESTGSGDTETVGAAISDPSQYFNNVNNSKKDVYVRINWGDGTSQYVKVPVTITAVSDNTPSDHSSDSNNSTDITPATDNSDDAFDNAVTTTTNNNTSDNTTSNVAADYGQAIVRAGQIDVYTLPKGNLVRHHTHLNKGTRLTIYEIRKIDGQNWYRIGNSRWIMAASTINTKGSAIYLHQMLKGYAVVWVQKIAVYNKVNGKKTKTYLKRNAKRKILSVVTVNGGQWYQIGKKQWIPAASAHFVVAD